MHTRTFYTNKNIKETKIAILSDIHFYDNYNLKIFTKIIKQLQRNKPNYITIVGDILDTSSTSKLDHLRDFLENISKISPTMVVIGNHDEKAGSMWNWTYEKNEELIKILNSIENIHFLNDTTYKIDNITFYGFNLSYKYYEIDHEDYNSFCKEINKLKCNLNDNTYNIILFHSPINIYPYIINNPNHNLSKSNLILSGHMHNGCLPYFISNPLNKLFKTSRSIISPTRKLFPKYAQGKIKINNIDGYVYEGITKLSHSTKHFHKLDIFFPKNVQFITIKKY